MSSASWPRDAVSNVEILGLEPRLEKPHIGGDIVDDEYSGSHLTTLRRTTNSGPQASPAKRRTVSRNVATDMGFDT